MHAGDSLRLPNPGRGDIVREMGPTRLDGRRGTARRSTRATALVGLAFLLASCQASTSPVVTGPPGATAPASPTAAPTQAPTAASSATPAPAAVPSATTAGAPRAAITHVVVVWLENRDASAVTAASMPYLYGLAETYGRADRYDAVTHPSLPNYLAFWS